MKTAIELITQERNEQQGKHNYSQDHDIINNVAGQLAIGAEMLLASTHEEGIDPESYPEGWNHDVCRNMLAKPYLGRLVIAASLIAAEIDRIQNTESDSMHTKILQNIADNEFLPFFSFKYIKLNDIGDLDRVSRMCTEGFRHMNLQTRDGRSTLESYIQSGLGFAFNNRNNILTWEVGNV